MKESVIYQDILQKGQKEGEKLGEMKGEKNEAFRLVSRLLNRKFGAIDSSTLERIKLLTTEQLETLGVDLLNSQIFQI